MSTNFMIPRFDDLLQLCSPQPEFDVVLHNQIMNLASQYCLCSIGAKCAQDHFSEHSTEVGDLVIKHQSSRSIKPRKKNRLLKSRNTQDNLERLESMLTHYKDDGRVIIYRSPKSKSNTKCFRSGRRSTFIGVSKNGDVWQSLIMIDSKKTYIGSYHTEEEAALAYDFYSIVMKHFAAKTNFDYTLLQVKRMVKNYHDNCGDFVPAECL